MYRRKHITAALYAILEGIDISEGLNNFLCVEMINQGRRDSLIEANKVVPSQKDTSSS